MKRDILENNKHQLPPSLFYFFFVCFFRFCPAEAEISETSAHFFLGAFLLQGFQLPVLVFVDEDPAPLDVRHGLVRQRADVHLHARTSTDGQIPQISQIFQTSGISHLGIQQIQADSVVHDVSIVRRVPVAARTKSSSSQCH